MFNKVFMGFWIFCNEVLRAFANWQIWAKKKAVHFGTAFKWLFLI